MYPTFVDGATGTQGIETDTGLTYNPSTGLLTATGFSGNLTGTLQTASQTNITAVGTITTGVWQGTAIASGYIANDAIDSQHYTDGSIDQAHMSANSVDSDQYVDGSIDTAHIADDQVTLAKMAGLTRGSMIIGDSSGNPTALAKGNANYVLTSDGTDIAWAAASGGGTTINNATANELVTVGACTDELCAEANLLFDGQNFTHQYAGQQNFNIASYSTTNSTHALLNIQKSDNGSVGSHTALDCGENIGSIQFQGSNGSAFVSGANILARSTEAWSSNRGTALDVQVVANGATALTKIATFTSSQALVGNGTAAAPSISFICDTCSGMYRIANDQVGIAAGGNMQWTIQNGPTFYNDTASSKVGKGVLLNQGACDLIILDLKSSDVAHGLTAEAETDTYGFLMKTNKCSHALGGLEVNGIVESGGIVALHLRAFTGNDDNSAASSMTNIPLLLEVGSHNGSNGDRAFSSNAKAVAMRFTDGTMAATRFLFDVEGDFHADSSSTTFDDYCDIELLRGFQAVTVPCYKETYMETFGKDIMYNLCWYQDNHIIGKDSLHWEHRSSGKWEHRAMVNYSALTRLHHSTIIQLADRVDARLTALENQIALEGGK